MKFLVNLAFLHVLKYSISELTLLGDLDLMDVDLMLGQKRSASNSMLPEYFCRA